MHRVLKNEQEVVRLSMGEAIQAERRVSHGTEAQNLMAGCFKLEERSLEW